MRILHVANQDVGGAARAMLRLHEGLLSQGEDSHVLVAKKKMALPKVEEWKGSMNPVSRVQRRSRRWWLDCCAQMRERNQPVGFELFTDDRTRFGDHIVDDLNEFDLVNFHWISQFVDHAKVFPRLKVPVVWTLHDQNPFTGGCHYDFGCERWRQGCGSCPQLGSDSERDFSAKAWLRKKEVYQRVGEGMHIVTPSEWLGKLAQESPLLGSHPVRVIPYGVPTDIFHPGGRSGLRSAFKIGDMDRVILFVSDNLNNRRKGFQVLRDALRALRPRTGSRVVVLSVGVGSENDLGEFEHHHLGTLRKEELVSAAFSAADIFVAPALQDNLPNTLLESLACGTPIVGSRSGGIPDAVRPGKTGWLFDSGSSHSLHDVLAEALSSEELLDMRKECREMALQRYSLEVQARKYISLYNEILP
ncbi:glycosyltransferase [Puniceicoccus vermicola]|uniref:Glycosyltransferase n=1 Tax=Puniceicoccus vermicola TaxID=388746 RepID=A0A7X1AYC0_9BACT|nr:glycosyltransferase [Puniceicoccus vermicola]MBC2601080.1 glycosyltransferase [Puniceicoccus vermicola]